MPTYQTAICWLCDSIDYDFLEDPETQEFFKPAVALIAHLWKKSAAQVWRDVRRTKERQVGPGDHTL